MWCSRIKKKKQPCFYQCRDLKKKKKKVCSKMKKTQSLKQTTKEASHVCNNIKRAHFFTNHHFHIFCLANRMFYNFSLLSSNSKIWVLRLARTTASPPFFHPKFSLSFFFFSLSKSRFIFYCCLRLNFLVFLYLPT